MRWVRTDEEVGRKGSRLESDVGQVRLNLRVCIEVGQWGRAMGCISMVR